MPTAVTIDIAVGRRVRIRAVARPARSAVIEDEADIDDAREMSALRFAVPSRKLALGVATVPATHGTHLDGAGHGHAAAPFSPARMQRATTPLSRPRFRPPARSRDRRARGPTRCRDRRSAR